MKRSIINPNLLVLMKHIVIGQEFVFLLFTCLFSFSLLCIGHHLGSMYRTDRMGLPDCGPCIDAITC